MIDEFAYANAANFAQPETRGQNGFSVPAAQFFWRQTAASRAKAGLTASQSQAAKFRHAGNLANFSDCMELAFAGLVLTAALLFTAALLRFSWIDGHIAGANMQLAARIVYAATGAMGAATLISAGRGIYHLTRR